MFNVKDFKYVNKLILFQHPHVLAQRDIIFLNMVYVWKIIQVFKNRQSY